MAKAPARPRPRALWAALAFATALGVGVALWAALPAREWVTTAWALLTDRQAIPQAARSPGQSPAPPGHPRGAPPPREVRRPPGAAGLRPHPGGPGGDLARPGRGDGHPGRRPLRYLARLHLLHHRPHHRLRHRLLAGASAGGPPGAAHRGPPLAPGPRLRRAHGRRAGGLHPEIGRGWRRE